jgi:hypothetical protein
LNWGDSKNVVVQEKATPANKTLYNGIVLEALAYAYQFHETGGPPVYTLYDFALVDAGKQTNKGVEWVDIDGPNGPVELEKAHISLANIVLGVSGP